MKFISFPTNQNDLGENDSFEHGKTSETIDSVDTENKNDLIPFPNIQSADEGSLNKSTNDNESIENNEIIVSNFCLNNFVVHIYDNNLLKCLLF